MAGDTCDGTSIILVKSDSVVEFLDAFSSVTVTEDAGFVNVVLVIGAVSISLSCVGSEEGGW